MSLRTHHATRAFSMVELVLVVLIIGVLSAIAIPRLSRGADGADINAFARSLSELIRCFEQEYTINGAWPDQQPALAIPPVIANQFYGDHGRSFTNLGGGDWTYKNAGVNLLINAKFDSKPDEDDLQRVDAIVDDGDLSAGRFTKKSVNQYEYRFE